VYPHSISPAATARRHPALSALLLASLLACGGGDVPVGPDAGPDAAPEPAGELEVGTAVGTDGSGFAAVEDGADVVLTAGIQGGFHIWVNVRVSGFAGEYYLEWDARRVSDDALVSRAIPQYLAVGEEALDGGWWENPSSMPSFMCPTPIGIKVNDEELYFDVRVVDADDRVMAQDTLSVVARCPEGELAEFCSDICSGEP
jgi:hypothetical protein